MAKLGKYKIPRPLQDEDKWFRFFTKKQLLYFLIAGVLSIGIIALTFTIHLVIIGVVVAIFLVTAAIIIPRVDMPADRYLVGGGMPLESIVIRIVVKYLDKSRRNIYVKNVLEDEINS